MVKDLCPPREAILIMDSRSTPHLAVRKQNFSGFWSKLYKAGELYLDLTFRSEGANAVLMGQVITNQELLSPRVVLHSPGKTSIATTKLTESGRFRFEVKEPGDHLLELGVGEETFMVQGLEIF